MKTITSASKTNLFYFLYKFKRYETAECPKRTERSINVQWTFIANGPACARCLDAIVKYLVAFKKNKISLDFLFRFASRQNEKRKTYFIIPYFFHCQKSIKKSRTSYFYLKLFVPS